MAIRVARKPPAFGNRMFDHSVHAGIAWFRQGDTPNVPPTSALIVEFIQNCLLSPLKAILDRSYFVTTSVLLLDLCLVIQKFLRFGPEAIDALQRQKSVSVRGVEAIPAKLPAQLVSTPQDEAARQDLREKGGYHRVRSRDQKSTVLRRLR
jgi:hypothetical protein